MKKILSVMLLSVGIIFCSQFTDISKASAKNYVFICKGYHCNVYLDTDSVQIDDRNPLAFGCRIYYKATHDLYKALENETYYYFKTYTYDGSIRYSINGDKNMLPFIIEYDDTVLISIYQYVLYNY